MIPLSRQQVRAVDRLAIGELGIPGVVLMENAGRNATELIQAFIKQQGRQLDSALLFCGGGNNGGDGYVIARHLHNRNVQVTLLAHKSIDQLAGDARINAQICRNMNLSIHPTSALSALTSAPSIIIDALLGTGFQGELRDDLHELIQSINRLHDTLKPSPVVVAIDLPSGLDCDTGRPPTSRQGALQHAVKADLTVTFVAPKLGFSQPAAWPYVGKVEVADIGAPSQLISQITSS